MSKEEYIEHVLREYEQRHGELPVHNRGIMRGMLSRDYDFWEGEEGRVLNDNNRYPE